MNKNDKRKRLSRQVTRKNKKFKKQITINYDNLSREDEKVNFTSISNDIFPEEEITDDIIFNPSKHRTQHATREISAHDTIYYIENLWNSISLCPSDRISSKEIKTQYNISTKDLLIQALIREASENNSLEISEIPQNFLSLILIDIIKEPNFKTSIDTKNKRLWTAFGRWLGLKNSNNSNGLLKRRQVRQHLRLLWVKLGHAHIVETNRNLQELLDIVNSYKSRKEKTKLIISARDNYQVLNEIIQFKHLTYPECITDENRFTLIHLEQLDDKNAVLLATTGVNNYYFHMLDQPSHRSEEFWTNFIEHFGAYARNNTLPFTSSNTASTHNIEHRECVNKLFKDLKPLSDSINRFLQNFYKELYIKLSKLTWGPFAPKPFGVFPMIAINFNTISDFHWDEHDAANSLCILVALGDYNGGELCFPELQIIVHLRPGQVVAFASRLLLHGNFQITKGIRHSIVYFVHTVFFKDSRNFDKIYDLAGFKKGAGPMNSEQDLNKAQNLNKCNKILKPKTKQIQIPPAASDKRRGCIDLSRARRGLKAEDPL